ncbi:histidine kinase [Salinispirillum sp. LH 10-3-1]|uniref:Histidine kinase n=1 Tax=Salinispirillum sp. LH 10-3-1 TaxID=2952525 RepID=A0AB38YGS6_9GAMM
MAFISRSNAPGLCSDTAAWFVLLICQLLALIYALLGGPEHFWWQLAMASLYAHWVGLIGLVTLCQLQRRGIDGSRRLHWLCYWLALSVITLAGLALGYRLLAWLLPAQAAPSSTVPAMQALAIVLFCALLLRYWYLQHTLALRQKATTQAQLDALQARINPHFLFNALNAIAALVRQDARQAENAVEQLSDLMRASLQPNQTLITLAEELALTQAYAGLEQARFGERLRLDWQINNELLQQPLPILSLQPLVENAVRHGIGRLVEGGIVTVKTYRDDRRWWISVSNPLPPSTASHDNVAGNGIALDTLRARGEALIGDAFELTITSTDELYTVTMCFTHRTDTHDDTRSL